MGLHWLRLARFDTTFLPRLCRCMHSLTHRIEDHPDNECQALDQVVAQARVKPMAFFSIAEMILRDYTTVSPSVSDKIDRYIYQSKSV